MCCFALSVSADTTTDINGGITSGGGGAGGSRTNYGNVLEAYLNSLGDYINGDITIDEFLTTSNKIISENEVYDRLGGNYIEGITSGVVDAVEKFGDNAQHYISDWYQDFLKDYTDLAQIESPSNPDKKGYGAIAKGVFVENPNTYHYYYCDYIVLHFTDEAQTKGNMVLNCPNASSDNEGVLNEDYNNGSFSHSTFYGTKRTTGFSLVSTDARYVYTFYGDVRNADGTEAETDEEYVDVEVLDFSDTSDDELEKLLEDLLNKLNLEMPDLSSIEGILQAIYNQTCGISQNMLTYDDCNFLIMSLMANNDENTQDIVKALFEIRDELKNGDNTTSDEETDETEETEDSEHPNHICGTLYNVKPLDKNWLNKLFTDVTELKVEYQGNKYYLESCGCLLLDDKYYSVDMNYDSYTQIDYDFSNEDVEFSDIVSLKDGVSLDDIDFGSAYDINSFIDEEPVSTYSLRSSAVVASVSSERNFLSNYFTDGQVKKIDWIVDIIDHFITLGIPYDSINNSIYMFESIIFDDYTPKDLTFNAFDTEITILSYSWFCPADNSVWDEYDFKEGLDIVRLFSSILIGFAWVLAMRKKIVSML